MKMKLDSIPFNSLIPNMSFHGHRNPLEAGGLDEKLDGVANPSTSCNRCRSFEKILDNKEPQLE